MKKPKLTGLAAWLPTKEQTNEFWGPWWRQVPKKSLSKLERALFGLD